MSRPTYDLAGKVVLITGGNGGVGGINSNGGANGANGAGGAGVLGANVDITNSGTISGGLADLCGPLDAGVGGVASLLTTGCGLLLESGR